MMRAQRFRLLDEKGQFGLIALLVTLVLGCLLVYVFLGPSMRSASGPGPETIPGKAIEKGHDTECQANLNSIRQAITMQRTENETPPASIKDIQVGTSNPSYFKCPVGEEDFVYDPTTGSIKCPHPGHEQY